PQVLYAGTGEGDIYYYRLIANLTSINAAYEGSGILKTTNGGASWVLQGQAQFTGACFYKMAVHATNDAIAYGATNLGLYPTLNGGTTWTKLSSGLPVINSTIVACCDIVDYLAFETKLEHRDAPHAAGSRSTNHERGRSELWKYSLTSDCSSC
ncbi:MAG: WD40/YVTN/BNR-like repeat-containing protein, partial [Blastocatellia bacterium]